MKIPAFFASSYSLRSSVGNIPFTFELISIDVSGIGPLSILDFKTDYFCCSIIDLLKVILDWNWA